MIPCYMSHHSKIPPWLRTNQSLLSLSGEAAIVTFIFFGLTWYASRPGADPEGWGGGGGGGAPGARPPKIE
jgi:hypothetical protein